MLKILSFFLSILNKYKYKLNNINILYHFILECEAFRDIRENYASILAANSWDNLFSEEFVDKLGVLIVKLHRKRAEYKSQIEKQYVP